MSDSKAVIPNIVVDLGNGQIQEFDGAIPISQIAFTTKAIDSQRAVNDAINPHLGIKEQWAQAQENIQQGGTSISGLKVMGNYVKEKASNALNALNSKEGVGLGIETVGNALVNPMGPLPRMIAAPVLRGVNNFISDRETTAGDLAQATAAATFKGQSGEMLKNALKFGGSQVAGEVAKKYIDKKENEEVNLDLEDLSKRGAIGVGGAMISGLLDSGKLAKLERLTRDNEGQARVINQATLNDIILNPSGITDRWTVNSAVFAAGGAPAFERAAAQANQHTQRQLLLNDLKPLFGQPLNSRLQPINENTQFNSEFFVSAKSKAGESYAAIAKIDPTFASDIKLWKSFNQKANEYHAQNANAPKGDNIALNQAKQFTQKADSKFADISNNLTAIGQTGLAAEMAQARVMLSKIYAIEAATNKVTGMIDGPVFGKMLEGGREDFTGNLKLLAEIARINPGVLANPMIAASEPGLQKLIRKSVVPAAIMTAHRFGNPDIANAAIQSGLIGAGAMTAQAALGGAMRSPVGQQFLFNRLGNRNPQGTMDFNARLGSGATTNLLNQFMDQR